MPSRRVAVIGAGASGLVAARELRREGHSPVVLERAAAIGGTWLYDDEHSSVYASLRVNSPRECMGFLDFPFVAGTEGDPRRYPGHREVLRYLEAFAARFDLHGLVRLQTEVVSVRRRAVAAAGWSVSYRSKKLAGVGNEVEEEVFDAVVVCNGHFAERRLADIPGIEGWPGKQMHSHSYRVPDPFHGQVVVVVGYRSSGFDISREIAGVATEVHVADRSLPSTDFPCDTARCHNLWFHPVIQGAEEDGGVVFQDGTRVKADVIIHCTGYKYNYPFLTDNDCVISVDDNRVGPLYKHVFPPLLAPHISFIGLPFKGILFPMFQLQSNWVAGVLSGRIKLPSQEEMMHDVAIAYSELEARGCPKRYTHDLGGGTTYEYDDWLAEQCGQEGIGGWRKAMYIAARKNVVNRPGSYRDEWDDSHLLPQAHQEFTKYF
ncbi:Flavin-containing monooxygenase FMO GS-OX5 [Hordeum vulgare]|nr:Flavin-containing monooxygenase FMO GS-OX5 [Hordeum vulgare]KAI4983427.1 hypothetical protein ZWY2020_023919 [Hordeum vulgare]